MRPNTSCSSLRTKRTESPSWTQTTRRSPAAKASLRRRKSKYSDLLCWWKVAETRVFVLDSRYDSFKLQRLQQKKLDRQEARMEKQMFVGKLQGLFPSHH